MAPGSLPEGDVYVEPFAIRRFPVTNREYLGWLLGLLPQERARHVPRRQPDGGWFWDPENPALPEGDPLFHPDAPVVAHPECTYAVRMLADEVCSTEKMVSFCRESPMRHIIVVTEAGLLHRLRKEIPDKTFIPGPTDNCFCGECRFMKMNTLEKAYDALLNMDPEITLPEAVRKRAEAPILRMLELSK